MKEQCNHTHILKFLHQKSARFQQHLIREEIQVPKPMVTTMLETETKVPIVHGSFPSEEQKDFKTV